MEWLLHGELKPRVLCCCLLCSGGIPANPAGYAAWSQTAGLRGRGGLYTAGAEPEPVREYLAPSEDVADASLLCIGLPS